MIGLSGYVLLVGVWAAIVVAAAIIINIAMESVEHRRRNRDHGFDGIARPKQGFIKRGLPPVLWITVACVAVSVIALFAMAVNTVTAHDGDYSAVGLIHQAIVSSVSS